MDIDRLFQLIFDEADDGTIAALTALRDGNDEIKVDEDLLKEEGAQAAAADPIKSDNLYRIIKDATIPQKIKLAMFGNQAVRNMLIRDTNRLIPQFVLQNPRISDTEINEFARNKDLDENVLREIGNNTTWMKNYSVKVSLCFNPKVPVDISMRWIKHLATADLTKLGKSKNVPQVIATQGRKLAEQRRVDPNKE